MSDTQSQESASANQLAIIPNRYYVVWKDGKPIATLNKAIFDFFKAFGGMFTTVRGEKGDKPISKFKKFKDNIYYLEVGINTDNITAEDEQKILQVIQNHNGSFLIGKVNCNIFDSIPDDETVTSTIDRLTKGKVFDRNNQITIGSVGIRIQPDDVGSLDAIKLNVVTGFIVNALKNKSQNTESFRIISSGVGQNITSFNGTIKGQRQYGIFCAMPDQWSNKLKDEKFQYNLPDANVIILTCKVIDFSIAQEVNKMRSYSYTSGSDKSYHNVPQRGYNRSADGGSNQRGYNRSADGSSNQRGYNQSANGGSNQRGYNRPVNGGSNQRGYNRSADGGSNQRGYNRSADGGQYYYDQRGYNRSTDFGQRDQYRNGSQEYSVRQFKLNSDGAYDESFDGSYGGGEYRTDTRSHKPYKPGVLHVLFPAK